MDSKDDYALITGASLGIGKEIAIELSRKNINTLLIALDTPELIETSNYISENYNTQVDSLGVNLIEEGASDIIYDWCIKNKYHVSTLINNAGFGEGGYFEEVPLARYYQMMDLNNKAYISMIHKFLPEMKKKKNGRIMNTSSMEAFLPLPYKAVYTGTKNFVYAFSLALAEEVKNHKVTISVLCPGPVLTNKGGLERLESQGGKAKLLLLMPDMVAKIAVKNMLRGKLVINPGKMNWWITKLAKFMPTKIKMRLLERIFRVYK